MSSVEHKMLNKPPVIKSKWGPGAVKLQKGQTWHKMQECIHFRQFNSFFFILFYEISI